jgi:hypothetical protein
MGGTGKNHQTIFVCTPNHIFPALPDEVVDGLEEWISLL